MKTGYVQNSPVFGEKRKNFDEISYLLAGVTADLIVLPELFATGYTFVSKDEVALLAEEGSRGETFDYLQELSTRTKAVIVGGFAEKENGCFYNSAMMVSAGRLIGIYRKIYLFNKEKLWFSPGNLPLKVYQAGGARIGMMICFDWIFPEVCRSLALKGAQVIAHPSNLVLPFGQAAMVTRCLENRVFAVTANRTGTENRGEDCFTFTGGSQVVSCDGTVLSSAPVNSPFVEIVEIDEKQADSKKVNAYNDLFADRETGLVNY